MTIICLEDVETYIVIFVDCIGLVPIMRCKQLVVHIIRLKSYFNGHNFVELWGLACDIASGLLIIAMVQLLLF